MTHRIAGILVALAVLSGCTGTGSNNDDVVDNLTPPQAVEVFDHLTWGGFTVEFGALKGIDGSLDAWVDTTLPRSADPFGYVTCAALGCTLPEPVVWRGRLAGVTTDTHEAVRGNAELRVELKNLTGDLTFDAMSWARGPLHYDVQVRDTGFASANGEATGAFYGPNHEVLAGTVSREDLIAAFAGQQ